VTFVDAFYSFSLSIALTDEGVYAQERTKIPKHPEEPLTHLIARVLAYCHAYREGLTFSPGFFDTKQPTLFTRSIIGETTFFAEVGDVDPEKVQKLLKKRPTPEARIYFSTDEQALAFAQGLKGSKENWIADISFFKVEQSLLDSIAAITTSSSSWDFTTAEGMLYLGIGDATFESPIIPLEMWKIFQEVVAEKER
jgi:uncharacterized protein YaeQ